MQGSFYSGTISGLPIFKDSSSYFPQRLRASWPQMASVWNICSPLFGGFRAPIFSVSFSCVLLKHQQLFSQVNAKSSLLFSSILSVMRILLGTHSNGENPLGKVKKWVPSHSHWRDFQGTQSPTSGIWLLVPQGSCSQPHRSTTRHCGEPKPISPPTRVS